MRAIPLFLLLFACSPESASIRSLTPSIGVSPSEVDFGPVGVLLSETDSIFVSNAGGADLDIELEITTHGDVFLLDSPLELTVRPGADQELPLTFAPATFRDYRSSLVVRSNDAETPEVVVDLAGEGADLPLPDLAIHPGRTIEEGNIPALGQGLFAFEIRNQGGSALRIEALRLEGPDSFELLSTDREGSVLDPQDRTGVLVGYEAEDEEGAFADLFITSNDPDEPEAQVRLIANDGGLELERPVAVIDCPEQVLLTGPERVALSGGDSYDPDGFVPLFYQWRVTERPDASDDSVPLDPDDTRAIDLYVDVAGTWEVELVVRNNLQTFSEPVTCSFEAVPEDALHVELSWDTPTADLDLHLVKGGQPLFHPNDDCHFCNKNPNWGESSTSVDDPRLDIDDRGGFGPENINIEAPVDGTYDVYVHYWKRNDDKAVTATLRIYLDGELTAERTNVLADQREVWEVGTISIPESLFVDSGVPNYDSEVRRCLD